MKPRHLITIIILVMTTICSVWAGGSGLNVIVVVNQNSTNSVQLANEYCELRGVPPQNVLRLTNTWSGGAISCTLDEFQTNLFDPLMDLIQSRNLTNQIEYVLLSMDLPYTVIGTNGENSTTSVLFYGFKPDGSSPGLGLPTGCSLLDNSSNSYAFSELPFSTAPPDMAMTNSFLTMMLTDSNLVGAETILSRSVAADSTFPNQTVILAKTDDYVRNFRYFEFDNAIFDARLQEEYPIIYTNTDFTGFTNILGLQTGLANLTLATNAFVPGAIGDSMTSYAGMLFVDSEQVSLLSFLESGAAGSYGTVLEPCIYLQKFPNPLDYFYQSRGFSLAESYYQSVQYPYQGLFVGEPLSAPFAYRGTANWDQLPANQTSMLAGQTNLELQFNSAATNLPLAQVDLFVDGVWYETVTNLQPSPGDQLALTLNGVPISYTVPANATIASVAAGLVAAINSVSNSTSVAANLGGDRISEVVRFDGGFVPFYAITNSSSDRVELHSLNPSTPAAGLTFNLLPVTNTNVPTTFMTAAPSGFLDSIAKGYHYLFVTNSPAVGDWIQLDVQKTNGNVVTIGVTNTSAGTTAAEMVSILMNEIAANPALQSSDGIYADEFDDYSESGFASTDFILFSQSPGWAASQIQVTLNASHGLKVIPSGPSLLQDNLPDLQPRSFLTVASGALSLPINLSLDTTKLPDGFHKFTFVAYEGTSVQTQTHISREVQIQNNSLQATLSTVYGGSNTDLNATMLFSVVANTNDISSIELFGTGGSLGIVNNQSNALFSVSASFLGLGLHPFYAVVTDNNGNQYRTQTTWIRIIGTEPPFSLSVAGPPVTISWTATAGRSYDILETTNLYNPFQVVASFVPSNSPTIWTDSNSPTNQTFYYVRTSN